MSEFDERWAKLSPRQRRSVKREMRAKALETAKGRVGLSATNAQLKAAAKTMVDIATARARRVA